jgi:hypothetical protein
MDKHTAQEIFTEAVALTILYARGLLARPEMTWEPLHVKAVAKLAQ